MGWEWLDNWRRTRAERRMLKASYELEWASTVLEKSKNAGTKQEVEPPKPEEPKSDFFNPFMYLESADYKESPSVMIYDWLRRVVNQCGIAAAIHQVITNSVAECSRKAQSRYDLGGMVVMKDRDAHPSPADKKEMSRIEKIIFRENINAYGPTFEYFLRATCPDLLTFDQMNFEIVGERGDKKKPAAYYPVDAATIRIASEELKKEHWEYVQVIDGATRHRYKAEDMAWVMMNPRTELGKRGYGTSCIEQAMITMTEMIWTEQYNANNFRQGSMTKSIINFRDDIPENQQLMIRQQWRQLVTGVGNAWRTPIMCMKNGVEVIDLQKSNLDMEYQGWLDFLIKVFCAAYNFDPIFINFQYGNTGQTGSLGGQDNESKFRVGRIKYLRPILRAYESALNSYIVEPRFDGSSPFLFNFCGIDAETEQIAEERRKSEVMYCKTVNEIRAEKDEKPDPYGDIILNPTYLQWRMYKEANEKQEKEEQQQGGGEQGGGQENDQGGDEGNAPDEPQKDESDWSFMDDERDESKTEGNSEDDLLKQAKELGKAIRNLPLNVRKPKLYRGWKDDQFYHPALNDVAKQAGKIFDENVSAMLKEISEVLR